MGVSYYLVIRDRKEKRALVIYLGSGYGSDVSKKDIDKVDDILWKIDEMIEKVGDVEEKSYRSFRIKDLVDLITIKRLLEEIKYGTEMSIWLPNIMKVYGLVMVLTDSYDEDRFDWEITTSYSYSEIIEQMLKKDGYKIIEW